MQAPPPRSMNNGVAPTDLKARTGLSTPPGRIREAAAKSFSEDEERERFFRSIQDDSRRPECHRQFPTATCNRARGEFWRERVLERAEAIEVTDLNTEPRRRARRYTELIWPADSAVRRWARAAR